MNAIFRRKVGADQFKLSSREPKEIVDFRNEHCRIPVLKSHVSA
jgi:hypothetical protein